MADALTYRVYWNEVSNYYPGISIYVWKYGYKVLQMIKRVLPSRNRKRVKEHFTRTILNAHYSTVFNDKRVCI
mgnify:CR=1 FL=1